MINQDSSGYELIDYYECGIAPYRCGRFSKLSRIDDPAHVFVDVFVLDHDCCRNNEESVERYPRLREVLQTRIWETCMKHGISSSNAPIKDENQKRIIDKVFDDFLREVSTPDGENYQWGWEQFLSLLPVFFDKKELYPLQAVPFKDSHFYIPFDAESILRARYGNIYSIPTDMYADFHSNVFGYVDNRSIIHELADRLRRAEALSDF